MKTLNTIQTISKIGKILCKIVFILCIVGGVGCIVGIISLACIPDGFKLGGVTVHSLIESTADISVGTCYAAMAVGIVLCAGEAVLSKLAGRYFKNELEAGTPFTFEGAKEMMRLGICAVCIPVASAAVSAVVYAIMNSAFDGIAKIDLSNGLSLGMGVMFIIMSLFCRHGAEISAGEKPTEKTEDAGV